jgi:hypothetical protein
MIRRVGNRHAKFGRHYIAKTPTYFATLQNSKSIFTKWWCENLRSGKKFLNSILSIVRRHYLYALQKYFSLIKREDTGVLFGMYGGEKESIQNFRGENLKERYHLQFLGVKGKIQSFSKIRSKNFYYFSVWSQGNTAVRYAEIKLRVVQNWENCRTTWRSVIVSRNLDLTR